MTARTTSPEATGPGGIILRNAAFLTVGDTALKALTFLFNVFVVRRLGDERFGQYSIVLAFVGLFSIFVELGMTEYVTREIARDRSKTRKLFWNLVFLRLLLAVFGVFVITGAGFVFGYPREIVLGIGLYTTSFLLAAIQAPLVATLTANERFDYATAVTILERFVFVTLGGLFLLQGLGFIYLIVASLLSFPLQIGLAAWAVRRHGLLPSGATLDPGVWGRLVRASLPFGMISLMLTIAFGIDTVILSMYEPDRVVGWYNVAYGLVFSLMFLSRGIKRAMVPSLARTYVSDKAYVESWYYRSVKLISMISLPIAVGGMLIAFPLIRFLYTDEFLPAGLALQILIWDIPLLMFTSFSGSMATIIGEERVAARVYGLNTAANVLLNLYAIPRFGLVGAALVTVVTDFIGAVQFYAFLRHKLKLPKMTSLAVRVVAAAALMGVAVWAAQAMNLILVILVGVVTYSLLALVFRLVGPWERQMIRRFVRRAAVYLQPRGASF